MKRFFLLAAFLLSVFAASAQDIIVKQNGEEIQAKVEEVGVQSIRYRKFSNLSGPIYSIARNDVFMIRYESGSKDIITPLDKPATTVAASVAPEQRVGKLMAATRKKLERKKMSEFGVRAEIGMAGWSAKDLLNNYIGSQASAENNYKSKNELRLGLAASVFVERYFSKKSESYIGLGVGYMQAGGGAKMSATLDDTDERASFSMKLQYDGAFVNLYYGMRPIERGFHFRVGFRACYLAGMKVKMEVPNPLVGYWPDNNDGLEPNSWYKIDKSVHSRVCISGFFDFGYTFGHSDIGVQYLFGMNEIHDVLKNQPWTLGLSYNYRF